MIINDDDGSNCYRFIDIMVQLITMEFSARLSQQKGAVCVQCACLLRKRNCGHDERICVEAQSLGGQGFSILAIIKS